MSLDRTGQKNFKEIFVPTAGGWAGGAAIHGPMYLYLNTSTTPNQTKAANALFFGLNSGDIIDSYCDYTKRLEWEFFVNRYYSDSEVVAYVQIKQTTTHGDLADVGIGLKISNYTVIGEAYGTQRGTTPTLVTLADNKFARIKIVFVPGVRVEFWVNGVLIATLTGAYVPVAVNAMTYMVASIKNGATGGVNAYLYIGNIKLVQNWS